jgi:hypothetical protein
MITALRRGFSPPISRSRRSALAVPISSVGCETVLKGGSTMPASSMSSKPITSTSCGTGMPHCFSARKAPMAMTSFAAKTALNAAGVLLAAVRVSASAPATSRKPLSTEKSPSNTRKRSVAPARRAASSTPARRSID